MKKKIIGVAVLATIVISAAAWNFNQGKNETRLSELGLANVEALAGGEGGMNNKSLAQKSNGAYCCAKNNGNNCTQSPDC